MGEATCGVLDTSVVIDHDQIDADRLPDESAITAVTLAELATGPNATERKDERARRQDRLQWATATWDPLPFDAEAARIYGRPFAAERAAGRSSRARLADLLIAATAAANDLPLYPRKSDDFGALSDIVRIIKVDDSGVGGRCARLYRCSLWPLVHRMRANREIPSYG
jgi:predicted nucleic acid-binding protein